MAIYILIKEPLVINAFLKHYPQATEHMPIEGYRGFHLDCIPSKCSRRLMKHMSFFMCPDCNLLYECVSDVLNFNTLFELECHFCENTTSDFKDFIIPFMDSWKYVKSKAE